MVTTATRPSSENSGATSLIGRAIARCGRVQLTGPSPFLSLIPDVQLAKLQEGIAGDLGRRLSLQHGLDTSRLVNFTI